MVYKERNALWRVRSVYRITNLQTLMQTHSQGLSLKNEGSLLPLFFEERALWNMEAWMVKPLGAGCVNTVVAADY